MEMVQKKTWLSLLMHHPLSLEKLEVSQHGSRFFSQLFLYIKELFVSLHIAVILSYVQVIFIGT